MLFAVIVLALFASASAQEAQLATFQETAQILVDRAVAGDVTASITLQTTSGQEVLVPSELAARISGDDRVLSAVLTNKDGCGVLGVQERACILVNTARSPADVGISGIREAARASADALIGGLNELFGTDARFHSVYIHPEGGLEGLLGTSGAVSGGGVVSVIYAMQPEPTSVMYERLTAKLLAPEIRAAGGFYDAARTMSFSEGAHAAVSIIPRESGLLYQVRLAASYPDSASESVDLLEYAGVDTMYRSKYFDGGSFPLNSVVQAVVISGEPVSLRPASALLPVIEAGGEVMPANLSLAGWVVDDSDPGRQEAYYLFGPERSVSSGDLAVRIEAAGTEEPAGELGNLVVPGIIVAVAAGAALFYLRGRSK